MRQHLGGLPARTRLPMALAFAYLLLYAAVYLTRPFGERGVTILSDFGEIPMQGLAVSLALLVAQADPRREARIGWALIASAIVADLAGNALYGAFDLAGQQPFPSVADAFYLAFYPLMLVGLVRLPTPDGRVRLFDWRMWSNVLIVVVGGGMVVLHFVLLPVAAQLDANWLAAAISLAYPLGDVALVAALATLMSRRPYQSDRLAIGWLIAATAVWFVADLLFAIWSADGSYAPGALPDVLWLLGDAGFFFAAVSSISALEKAQPLRAAEQLRIARLGSFAMLVLGLVTLLVASVDDGSLDIALLASLAIVLTGVVVARQSADERDRRRAEEARLAEHEAAATAAARLARTDLLTGLPNRLCFDETLRQGLQTARAGNGPLALVYADLDLFKAVNDTFGHEAGDRLLEEVGRRLSSGTRTADTVARLGGDEFAVILPGIGPEAGLAVAGRLETMLSRPYQIAGSTVTVTASFGVATAAGGPVDADSLMHQADVAMYRAKREHAGPIAWSQTLERPSPAITLVGELRRALDERALSLRFQPLCDLRTGAIVGCEALVRWSHPTLGLLEPDRFLPLAQRAGLMPRLDGQVLDAALEQLAAWNGHGLDLELSVNVSAASLAQPGLASSVAAALRAHGVPAAALTLELTEDALFDTLDVPATVDAIRRSGVRIALDDFGAGSSSLARLRDLEADSLKIDRSFVAMALRDTRQRTIVEGIVRLAHGLGLQVVAEGIEDEPTLALVTNAGVDAGQGYFIARPLEADALPRFLRLTSSERRVASGRAGATFRPARALPADLTQRP